MAPFMNMGRNLDEIEEEQVVPEGAYDLRITSAEAKRNKDDTRDMIEVAIAVEDQDYPNAESVFHYIVFPSEADFAEDEKKAIRMLRGVKRFCALFKISATDQLQTEDLIGATARANLGQEEYEGRVKNVLKVPRIR